MRPPLPHITKIASQHEELDESVLPTERGKSGRIDYAALGFSPSAAELPLGAIVGQVSELVGSMGGFSPTRALNKWTTERGAGDHAGLKSAHEVIKEQIAAERRSLQPQNRVNGNQSLPLRLNVSPYHDFNASKFNSRSLSPGARLSHDASRESPKFSFALTRRPESPKSKEAQRSPSRTRQTQPPSSLITSPDFTTINLQQYSPAKVGTAPAKTFDLQQYSPSQRTMTRVRSIDLHQYSPPIGNATPLRGTAPEGTSQFLLEEALRDLSKALEERKQQLVHVRESARDRQSQRARELNDLEHALAKAVADADTAKGYAIRRRRAEAEEQHSALEVLQRQLATERAALLGRHESEAVRLKDQHADIIFALRQRLSDLAVQHGELEERQTEAAKVHASAVRDLRNQAQSREEVHAAQARELRRGLQSEETLAATTAAAADAARGTLLALRAQLESMGGDDFAVRQRLTGRVTAFQAEASRLSEFDSPSRLSEYGCISPLLSVHPSRISDGPMILGTSM
eukprot:gnl/MRDRNA2_/MRDRNA2_73089_c0_seq2.p1 gnl/MRDRNA2_/MRDRNA2_73089_c0~~gnl/MRDRNA2_/MRDRNA2_73089_c0_seq2.p1  ORF type:complete len:517 (+),score=104.94 gnl/MRDRNA2_/MRDRNA2_73089_c0_seq2:74-1624(+)